MASRASYDVRIIQILWYNRIFTFDVETDAKKAINKKIYNFDPSVWTFEKMVNSWVGKMARILSWTLWIFY